MSKPLPAKPARGRRLSSKVVLKREVNRMRAAGEIPATITELSRKLRQRLLDLSTTHNVKPLKRRSIENRLRDWELWPSERPPSKL